MCIVCKRIRVQCALRSHQSINPLSSVASTLRSCHALPLGFSSLLRRTGWRRRNHSINPFYCQCPPLTRAIFWRSPGLPTIDYQLTLYQLILINSPRPLPVHGFISFHCPLFGPPPPRDSGNYRSMAELHTIGPLLTYKTLPNR
jgi:hypothetical protein